MDERPRKDNPPERKDPVRLTLSPFIERLPSDFSKRNFAVGSGSESGLKIGDFVSEGVLDHILSRQL